MIWRKHWKCHDFGLINDTEYDKVGRKVKVMIINSIQYNMKQSIVALLTVPVELLDTLIAISGKESQT